MYTCVDYCGRAECIHGHPEPDRCAAALRRDRGRDKALSEASG